FIGTSAIFFLILYWLKVPFYWPAGLFDANALMGILLPVLILVPVGVWLGRWLASKLNKQAFDLLIIALLFLTSLLLIFQALSA
ncbi:MAG: hypothetical protein J5I90_13850, partial [Caldilineales bacterium]|nr:hypothetical protein [Caldilineales bacterium]